MEAVLEQPRRPGIGRVAERNGLSPVELDSPVLPEKRQREYFKRLEIDRTVLEADVVINLPSGKPLG